MYVDVKRLNNRHTKAIDVKQYNGINSNYYIFVFSVLFIFRDNSIFFSEIKATVSFFLI